MAADRTVRFLQALGGASTSRVLNLGQVARVNRENPEHGENPLFTSHILNTSFILKHRTRSDETYLFNSARSVATKIIIPFDLNDFGDDEPAPAIKPPSRLSRRNTPRNIGSSGNIPSRIE